MFDDLLHKFTKTLGLDSTPDHQPQLVSNSIPSQPTFSDAAEMAPQTIGEFVELIKKTPKSILSSQDRRRIAAVMSFDDKKVRDLMIPRSQMVFVHDNEILGPLVLDKLYQSGFNVFPVVDVRDHVLGLIHTEALNALEIREADRAAKYLDSKVQYLHVGDSLNSAISAIEQTGETYFLVLDELDTLAGFFTIQQLFDYLLN